MKTPKNYYRLKKISEIIDQAKKQSPEFTLSFTSSSASLDILNNKFWFIDQSSNTRALRIHNRIKKEIGDLHADIEQKADFFDFSGLGKNTPKNCFCVDINSAYLTALKNEGLIKPNTYEQVMKSTQGKNRKMDRLKAIGLFASCKIKMDYIQGEPQNLKLIENPQNWVFWLACQRTTEAMQKIRELMPEDYLCYWVDGIFLKGNPYQAQEILKEMGFNSKIEKITDLKKTDKRLTYLKDGIKKILFLPKKNLEFKQIKNSIKL
jgi:hypothetical protein